MPFSLIDAGIKRNKKKKKLTNQIKLFGEKTVGLQADT